jgi:hypothetical protein
MIRMLKKLFFVLKTYVLSRVYINTNIDYHHSVLLSSMGRSGSTLLSNIINYNNDFRVIFEPFKYDIVYVARYFIHPCYMPPVNRDELLLKSLNTIITGRIRTAWTDKDNKKFLAKERLIKDIRTNLMLNWIRAIYLDLPIILLIRNPFAVIESWMREEWSSDRPQKRLLEQETILSPILPKGVFELYKLANTPLEKNLYTWCINYYIPLQKARENNYHITFYENYFSNPENETQALFKYLNKPFDPKALNHLDSFSRTTSKNSPLRKGQNILQVWKTKFSETEIENGIKILSLFELEKLYDFNDSGLPNLSSHTLHFR